jgi:hypothetical protein
VVHALTDSLTIHCLGIRHAPTSKGTTENLPDASAVEIFELIEQRFSDGPCFASLEEDAEDIGVIHRSLCM